MIFTETKLPGAYLIELERKEDHRGFNARAWDKREFETAALTGRLVQQNVIVNRERGTLRGLHFQRPPFAETKLFRVTRGAVYDVIVDLRPESPTYLQWAGFELRADTYALLYVPERFGQGFLTLEDDTELTYQVSEFYTPGHEGGIRYDDPLLDIRWPAEVRVISDKDRAWPPLQPQAAGLERVRGVAA